MTSLGEVVIIGGGCYGGFYLRQLVRARRAGALTWRRLLVVDRDAGCAAAADVADVTDATLVVEDWAGHLEAWLDPATRREDDRIVPSPLMPHLLAEWIATRARARWPDRVVGLVPVAEAAGTPFDRLHPGDGVRYLSHADWICPVHCIEPATCPVIRAPRSWDMPETILAWTARHGHGRPTADPAIFACRHQSHGVGMYGVTPAFDGLAALERTVAAHGEGDLPIASVSGCHGALALLRVEAA